MPHISRRAFTALGASLLVANPLRAQETPKRGGTLRFMVDPEPTGLVPVSDTTGSNVMLSAKVTEGLFNYNPDFSLRPALATGHTLSEDGKEITFTLRQGVKWHDGKPFTSADVAFSIEQLKNLHPRGRATFANVEQIGAPDTYTVVLKLRAPAPYLLNALAGQESPIIPKHIYEGSNPATNPHNVKPIGTGPFVFKEWVRGSHIVFERNPDYWDAGKPYLDRVIARFFPDPAARAIAFETDEVDVGGDYPVLHSDVERLRAVPHLAVETAGYAYGPNICRIEFNLDNPYFAKLPVRQAVAHAIDKKVILRNVWYGFGQIATGPIHQDHKQFYTADVPRYDFDVARANALLDEAGLQRGANGTRFSVTHDTLPIGAQHVQTGEYIKQALARVGIAVTLRSQDMPTYIRQVYAERKFDFTNNTMTNSPDPTLGVQRFYWSKNFRPGVPFSNASHYANPEVDRLLEAAQIEVDTKKRAELFYQFQAIIARDIPTIYTVAAQLFTLHNKRVRNHSFTADGIHYSLADTYLA